MGKWQIDAMLDAALNYIKNNATQMFVCSGQPANYAGVAAVALADKGSLSGSDFTGPADGDTNGRKLTVNAQTGITVDSSGDATHIALCSADTLLYVTTCTTQTLTAGNTVDTPAWDIEIADAA